MTTTPPTETPPFLDTDPPPWAVRALSVVLVALFAVGIVALFLVQVPETVAASFVLEPVRGADPIRTLHPGIVSVVNVTEAQVVGQGEVLFVLASELVGDRVSERQMVDTRLGGGRDRLTNERQRFENQQRADEQERLRLEQRLVTLERQAVVKDQQLTLARGIAAQRRREFDEGVLSLMDANRAKLEVEQLAGELEEVRTEIVDSRNTMARLAFEMASRRASFAELQRSIGEEMTTFRARKGVLDRDGSREGNAMSIAAPCAGTVVTLHVQHPGTVVHESDLMAELVCADEPLQGIRVRRRRAGRRRSHVTLGEPGDDAGEVAAGPGGSSRGDAIPGLADELGEPDEGCLGKPADKPGEPGHEPGTGALDDRPPLGGDDASGHRLSRPRRPRRRRSARFASPPPARPAPPSPRSWPATAA